MLKHTSQLLQNFSAYDIYLRQSTVNIDCGEDLGDIVGFVVRLLDQGEQGAPSMVFDQQSFPFE